MIQQATNTSTLPKIIDSKHYYLFEKNLKFTKSVMRNINFVFVVRVVIFNFFLVIVCVCVYSNIMNPRREEEKNLV